MLRIPENRRSATAAGTQVEKFGSAVPPGAQVEAGGDHRSWVQFQVCSTPTAKGHLI